MVVLGKSIFVSFLNVIDILEAFEWRSHVGLIGCQREGYGGSASQKLGKIKTNPCSKRVKTWFTYRFSRPQESDCEMVEVTVCLGVKGRHDFYSRCRRSAVFRYNIESTQCSQGFEGWTISAQVFFPLKVEGMKRSFSTETLESGDISSKYCIFFPRRRRGFVI